MKGSAYVMVRVDFEGDSYFADEMTDIVEHRISVGLFDTDDVVDWKFIDSFHVEL